jgi:UDP-N-acetyl-D-mannosaminuronic acid dehydrogenase
LATKGFNVTGIDVSQKVVDTINQGEIHIVEPDLDILVKSAVNSGNLTASLEPVEADVFIIAVPTPFKDGGPDHISGKKPDLSYIEAATKKISPFVRPGNLVILESTSPVGTTDEVVAALLKQDGHKVGDNVYIAHCPERVLPGKTMYELVANERVVGGMSEACSQMAVDFYGGFVQGQCVVTNARTAEMCKLTENAFRDVNIAFANELSVICDEIDVSVWELIKLANYHPRVDILQPGPGVGGHCIAVDPWFIVDSAPASAKIIRLAREINDSKPHYVISKVKNEIRGLKAPVIACLGLAFKPNVDDLRESPALEIVKRLAEDKVGDLMIVEPNIQSLPLTLNHYANVKFTGLNIAIAKADVILLLVDHKEFCQIDHALLIGRKIIDTRGILQ